MRSVIFAALGCGAFVPSAKAAPVLTTAYESQLETWLGLGPLDWTNIFTKSGPSDTPQKVARGRGWPGTDRIRWSKRRIHQARCMSSAVTTHGVGISTSMFNMTRCTDAGTNCIYFQPDHVCVTPATALNRPRLTSNAVSSRLTPRIYYGPMFGGGLDLYVGHDYQTGGIGTLNVGKESVLSYGPGPVQKRWPAALEEHWWHYDTFTVGALETYTFAQTAPVPEPTSLLLVGTGVAALVRRRRSLLRM